MIPRMIHQSWKSRRIPREYREYASTWRRIHPTWEYRLWTDDDNLQLVRREYDWLLPTYESYPLGIQRADMARILYVHKYGGLYADLDFECFRPFDQLMDQGVPFMGREKGGLGWYQRRLDYVSNALLASPPGHPFWELVLRNMVRRARPKHCWEPRTSYVLSTTGPKILDLATSEYSNEDLRIYSAEYFYPASVLEKSLETRRRLARANNSHAVHHFANSWFSHPMHAMMWLGYACRRPFSCFSSFGMAPSLK